MGTAPISEKDARRERVVTLGSWIAAVVATGMGTGAFLNSNPTLKVYVVVVPIYASIALLARRVPLWAGVALLVCSYSQIYTVTTMTGTGTGGQIFYWTLAGLAFALLGTERILVVVALFGILAVVLVLILEARVPYSTGSLSPERLFWAAFVPATVSALFALMATVYYPFDLPKGRRRRWRGTTRPSRTRRGSWTSPTSTRRTSSPRPEAGGCASADQHVAIRGAGPDALLLLIASSGQAAALSRRHL